MRTFIAPIIKLFAIVIALAYLTGIAYAMAELGWQFQLGFLSGVFLLLAWQKGCPEDWREDDQRPPA